MLTDEIAEAQVEIMEKMDPALLEMLKKRGRDKSGRKKGTGGQVEGINKRPKMGASGREWMQPGESSKKLWKIWRVESVRELRLALDESVVEAGSDQDLLLHGNNLDSNRYNVENVADHDFLRTWGDPAAVGYTVKEAVALIRSMVPGQWAFAYGLSLPSLLRLYTTCKGRMVVIE